MFSPVNLCCILPLNLNKQQGTHIQCNSDIRDPDIREIFLWSQIRACVTETKKTKPGYKRHTLLSIQLSYIRVTLYI